MATTEAVNSTVTAPMLDTTTMDASTDLTSEQVIAKIDELVNVAHFLKRVAKPMVRKYGKKKIARKDTGAVKRNGFAVPVSMADRLVTFLNTQFNTEYTSETILPRTQVTALMTQYIKDKELQVPDNRKNFILDSALCAVFNTPEGTMCNWFQLQKHMKEVVKSEKASDPEKKSVDDAGTDTQKKRTTTEETAAPASSSSEKTAPKRIKRAA